MRWSHSIRRRDIHKRVVVLSLVDRASAGHGLFGTIDAAPTATA